jgi:hypothetical protein
MINAKRAKLMTEFAKLSQIDLAIRKAASAGAVVVSIPVDCNKFDREKLIKKLQQLGYGVNTVQEPEPGNFSVTGQITISWN